MEKKLLPTHNNLLNHTAYKGALGAVTVFADVFDLYLITKYHSISEEELKRWLYAADINNCFRNIVAFDDTIRDFYMQNSINVTIASDREMIQKLADISQTYWILPVHVKDIQDGIQKVLNWNDIIREISKYASVENYELAKRKK